ncbi:MAG: response regulator, partial [Nannocystaceae bacterium]|nr:response regulator [Nannocystaceae bacterium]
LAYLRKEPPFTDASRPDVILLDLNMPRMNGKAFLEEVSRDTELRAIPVIVLTTSEAASDVVDSYSRNAASYITKPATAAEFVDVVRSFDDYWRRVVRLPPNSNAALPCQ